MRKCLSVLLVLFVFVGCKNTTSDIDEGVDDVSVVPDVKDEDVVVVEDDSSEGDSYDEDNSEQYTRLEPDSESRYCVSWLEICFSVPEGYYVFEDYSEDFPQYSYLAISKFDDPGYLPVGDGFMSVSSISLTSLDPYYGYTRFQDMIDGGVAPEYEVIPGEQVVTIGSYEFYKFLVHGFGASEYDIYFIENGGGIYDFKAGADDEDLMYGILESLEFKNDFNFIYSYGVTSGETPNRLNTFKDTFTQDMVIEDPFTGPMELSDDEMIMIQNEIEGLDLFGEKTSDAWMTPCSEYSLKVGLEDEITWYDCRGMTDDQNEFVTFMRQFIDSQEEFQNFPEPQAAYD